MIDQWLYFGCHRQPGHYLFAEGMRSYGLGRHLDKLSHFDGKLPRQDSTKPYIATVSRLEGWGVSALAFWDMDSSACKAWDAWQAAHLAGQRAMQTRAGEVANKTAERILAANTHRGRTSSAGSFASGVAEDIGCDIRALEVKP